MNRLLPILGVAARVGGILFALLIALASLHDAFAAPGDFETYGAVYHFEPSEGSPFANGLGQFVAVQLLTMAAFAGIAVFLVRSFRRQPKSRLHVPGATLLSVAMFVVALVGYIRWWQGGFDH